MLALSFLFKGALLGLSIAAPVGPVGILCIRRTIASGRTSGFVSGMGASCVHTTYGAIGAFGLTAVSNFLIHSQFWIKLLGGLFLLYLGLSIFRRKAQEHTLEILEPRDLHKHFFSSLLLSMTNPITLISFVAFFTSLEMSQMSSQSSSFAFVLGVFLGSASWWFTLSSLTSTFRSRINKRALTWINRISGTIIFSFGAVTLYGILPK